MHEHQITAMGGRRRMPEMVKADIVKCRSRLVARDVTAKLRIFLVCAQHQGNRIPADQRTDAKFHFLVARQRVFGVRRDRIDVSGIGRVGQIRAGATGLLDQLLQQKMRARRAVRFEHTFECRDPLARFLRVTIVFKEAWPVHETLLMYSLFEFN